MIGKTNAGKGADNPIIVEKVSDIDKLLVKDNVGKIFKYVGETFYPQGQATPIVANQPFEKLYVDTRRNPTVEEVFSWCDGGGSSGEPILFGVTSVSELESGPSASIYLAFFCSASNDQPVNACMILDYATSKGVYFMTSDGKFPDDPSKSEQVDSGITKMGWQIDGVYTKASFGLTADDPAYFVGLNSYYDNWKDYFSTTPFPDPWINNQLYEIVEDDNIKAKPIYILESLDADISPDNVLLGYQGYNDRGELITGTAYNDLTPAFLLRDTSGIPAIYRLIDTARIPANYIKELNSYSFAGFDNQFTVKIRGNITNIGHRCFYDSNINIEWEESETALNLNYNSFEKYEKPRLYLPSRVVYIGSSAFLSSSVNYLFISNIEKWFNVSISDETANPLYNDCQLYLVNTPTVDDQSNKITAIDLSGTTLTQIKQWAMNGCYSLTSIIFPTTLTQVGQGAFKNCKNLTSVTFNSNIQTLADKCFWKDSGQKLTISFSQSSPPIIGSGNEPLNKAYIQSISVPAGAKVTYISNTYWANFADLIQERT